MARATALVPFKDDGQLPAHLSGAFGDLHNTDLQSGVSGGYGVISFKGKTWSLNEGGNLTYIMRPDNPDEIASSLEVVLVKANPALSKVYYEGGYTEGSTEKPVCHSNDGLKPAADAASPQCGTCAACPHNAWGSRISDAGSKGKACADSRRIAVVPSGELGRPMLLRVPAATLKDLSQYAAMLQQRNAPYQAVVTKVGFDPTVAHPKLTFKAIRWLSAEEASEVATTMKSELVTQILGAGYVAPMQPVAKEVEDLGPRPEAPKVAKPRVPTKPKAVEPVAEEAPEEAPAPAPRGKVMAAAKVPAKPEPPKSKISAKIAEASDELDDALASIDDM